MDPADRRASTVTLRPSIPGGIALVALVVAAAAVVAASGPGSDRLVPVLLLLVSATGFVVRAPARITVEIGDDRLRLRTRWFACVVRDRSISLDGSTWAVYRDVDHRGFRVLSIKNISRGFDEVSVVVFDWRSSDVDRLCAGLPAAGVRPAVHRFGETDEPV